MREEDEDRSLRLASAVEPEGAGRYRVSLSPIYTILGHPNGGYLQCVLANGALAAASDHGATHQHASAVTTNFVRAPSLGDGELRAQVRRVGRGVSFVHVELRQNDELVVESLVTLATLREDVTPRYHDATPPTLAAREECVPGRLGEEVNILHVVDERLDPESVKWWSGEIAERAEVKAWLRLNDGEADWSPTGLLFAGDVLPPSTFPIGSSGWVPTLQLTSYVRAVPVGEWLRARQSAVVVADGLVDERCELFDETDRLVASSSQLAMVRFPEGR